MKGIMLLFLFFIASGLLTVQAIEKSKDSLACQTSQESTYKLSYKPFIIPTLLITYGCVALENDQLKAFDQENKEEFFLEHPHQLVHLDDYLQFSPGIAAFALSGLGIKGQHNLQEEACIYVLSSGISLSLVTCIKHLTKVRRPDGSAVNSFPSGHTTMAFTSAEFLHKEFNAVSPWISVAGYLAATGTGLFRMYNNKHWFSDIVAGAGIGMASTTLAYWLYDKIPSPFHKKASTMALFPTCSPDAFEITVVQNF